MQGNSASLRITYLMLIATTSFWGSAFVGSKWTVASIPPVTAAFIRFGLGAVFMFALLMTRERPARTIPKSAWLSVSLLGLVGIAAYNLFFFWGLNLSRATDGSMIIPTMSPVITVLLAAVFFKQKMKKQQITGLLLALLGSAVFFWGISLEGSFDHQRILGDLFFWMAALCWAVYTMYGNRVLEKLDPLTVTAYATLSGALLLGLLSAPSLTEIQWGNLGVNFWLIQLYLALLPTVLGNWFYYLGVRNIGAPRASVFMYFVPVSGLLLAALILDETLTFVQMIGSVLMIAGVWLVNRRNRPSAPVQKAAHETGKS
ncbi:DMT family transporter [Lihuaxuella thermophila]|uniref:Permease of the drug/metabolite transporter (DMT) superfamily n=1 Tax=Lihuaxuella thermophila TaxID=1173111 RepID=A0A1H8AIE8_9BACL|nr:DMT family transporter [Lihuaxuella thermophila]SEM69608.1 Permease of the drug/metabolite transporter (DMT) superfamily [Lihuaxuella thermophila]